MADPAALIARRTGDWWQDDRRNWCAYCGIAVKPKGAVAKGQEIATRDHVMPRAHKGRHVTIPACQPCNREKGATGLPAFLLSDYFSKRRDSARPNRWPLRDLWLVMALAAVEQARSESEAWPAADS